ncbi:hypothetical protein [Streptomyces sp. NPDC090022]|uniref:hypothetical protein n=1 Tax=Streptomyces sp. NPDC090022 TaxID=3365920 RepID=UPI003808A000
MHPSRTTTTLLLGVAAAVSAVSGCVNVTPAPLQPAAAPSAQPPQHAPRGGGAAPVVVQAPALEALEAVPERAPAAVPGAPARTAREAARPQERAAVPEEVPPPVPDVVAAPGASAAPPGERRRRGGRHDRQDRQDGEVPRRLVQKLPVRPADVCALGRKHGSWSPDSPEARICAHVRED